MHVKNVRCEDCGDSFKVSIRVIDGYDGEIKCPDCSDY